MGKLDEFICNKSKLSSLRLSVQNVFNGVFTLQEWKSAIKKEIITKLAYNIDYSVPVYKEKSIIRKNDYSIHHIDFSFEGLSCPLYILVPDSEPCGIVLALHGHGYGVLDIIGEINEETYQKKFALKLCQERGFIVVAPELIGFGTMRLEEDLLSGNPKQSSCHRLSMNLLSEGKTLLGLRVKEASVALSLAMSIFPDMKVGVMGISGGGTVATFLSVLRNDISAVVISGYANYFNTSILAMRHCVCNYLPGMLTVFELPDVLSAIAPVPMLWESGSKDPIYPTFATKKAEIIVRKFYSLFDKSDYFYCDYFEGAHEIHGKVAYDFLYKWLHYKQ